MYTMPNEQAKPSHKVVHTHLQRRFNKHRDKFDSHRARGPAFAAALDELEMKLFGEIAEN